ncbi:HlyD family efflux transporter periplasmic adaptor subunit [Verrucomicrobiota bacterium]
MHVTRADAAEAPCSEPCSYGRQAATLQRWRMGFNLDLSGTIVIGSSSPAMKHIPAIVAAAALACVPEVRGERIQSRKLEYRTSLPVTAFAEKAETISVPVHWSQILSCIPDGVYVEEGAVISVFDSEGPTNRLRQLELERGEIEAGLAEKLMRIRNKQMELGDTLETLVDRFSVLKTKLARYEAMPDKDEVEIGQGRQRVAKIEHDAAATEAEKARDRHKRKMISQAELDKFELRLADRSASLAHAHNHLAYAKLPASSNSVRKLELQMENVQMEIDKLKHEIEENKQISEIQKKGAMARREIIDKRITECKDDIDKLTVLAPISGHVMYLREFRQHAVEAGRKMWKDFNYMKIPDVSSLAFKGLLLESHRKFFKEGDAAYLRTPAAGLGHTVAKPIKARIASISKLSHDRGEKEEVGWGERDKSGVMVYDIVVKATNLPEEVKLGMNFTCELVSSQVITGPSVPTFYVREREDEHFLSFGGIYRKVNGILTHGYFVLDDESLDGRKIDLHGEFKEEDGKENEANSGGRFHISGELLPADTTDVVVRRIHRWRSKVTWLIEEDEEVQEGDVVARLDAKETDEEISRTESHLKQRTSERQALEEEIALQKKEGAFKLRREKNLREIAKIDAEIARAGRDWAAIFDAELSLAKAKIELEGLSKRLARVKGRSIISPLELKRLERDKARATLRVERAGIGLARLERGPDPVQRGKVELNYVQQKHKVDTLRKQIETDNFRASRNLARTKRHEARTSKWLKKLEGLKDHLVLKAPRTGIVQYEKIWNSGVFTKVNVGSAVFYRFIPMKIADVDQMYMRVEVPEKYYARIHKGLPVTVEVSSLTDTKLKGSVSEVKFLFENKRKKDTKLGLYSSHEPLGETVFHVDIQLEEEEQAKLKPGTIATVRFPFEK